MSLPIFACHSKGYAVMPLPKVASSSIAQTVVKARPKAITSELSECQDLFLFSFVRDPRDRLYSVWRNLVHSPPEDKVLLRGEGIELGMEFNAFAHAITPEMMRNPHLTPQSALLDGLYPEYIGRFERLSAHWELMRQKFHSIPPLKSLNRSEPSESWQEAYDTDTLGKVNGIYARDLDSFGYE